MSFSPNEKIYPPNVVHATNSLNLENRSQARDLKSGEEVNV
jgi:hypothetical protein